MSLKVFAQIWQHSEPCVHFEVAILVPIVSRTAIVDYTATEMFDLVTDVEAYPSFLPGCVDARTEHREGDIAIATIELAKGPVRQSFTTRNVSTPGETIVMGLERGPFKRLDGRWSFKALDDGASKVSLEVDFDFDSALMRATFGKVFNIVAGQMVEAFCRRAKVVYGAR